MKIKPIQRIGIETYTAGYILAYDTLHINKKGRIKFGTATIERIFKEASLYVKDGKAYKLILKEATNE